MTQVPPERWREVSPYLDEALSLSGSERARFLASFHAKNPELAALLETLLAEQGAVANEQFLERSALEPHAMTGRKLGPYQLEAQLGAGGMGEVYRAKDTRLDRTVAIKVLPRRFSSDPARRQRFDREAKAISALQHPNICTLYDVGRQDETDYLVMEYLEGETLAQRLYRGALPAEKTLQYGIEVADALDTAHRRGVVHRDLKPGNIFYHGARRDEGLGLWAGETGGGASIVRCVDGGDGAAGSVDDAWGGDGDGVVHVAGAGARGRTGRADGHLLAGIGVVRDGDGADGVCGEDVGGGVPQDIGRTSGTDHEEKPGGSGGTGTDRRQGAGEGPRFAVSVGGRCAGGLKAPAAKH